MVLTSSSSSSSLDSFSSFDEAPANICRTVKFLCSHGGRILPRYHDGRLRYVGGDTRVLSVDRSLSFSDLQAKLKELCGWESVNLRCRIPTEDLDALVSITSDEDLANLIEEWDLARRDQRNPIKIRAFLHPNTAKSAASGSTPPRIPISPAVPMFKASFRHPVFSQCVHQSTLPAKHAVHLARTSNAYPPSGCQAAAAAAAAAARHCLVNLGNHRQ